MATTGVAIVRMPVVALCTPLLALLVGSNSLAQTPSCRQLDPVPAEWKPAYDDHCFLRGDLDGDGQADIVFVGEQNVYVLLSELATNRRTVLTHQKGLYHNYRPTLRDINKDGKLDLLYSGVENHFVYFGLGNGSFAVVRRKLEFVAVGRPTGSAGGRTPSSKQSCGSTAHGKHVCVPCAGEAGHPTRYLARYCNNGVFKDKGLCGLPAHHPLCQER
jgi:FG-GAP-like repeat